MLGAPIGLVILDNSSPTEHRGVVGVGGCVLPRLGRQRREGLDPVSPSIGVPVDTGRPIQHSQEQGVHRSARLELVCRILSEAVKLCLTTVTATWTWPHAGFLRHVDLTVSRKGGSSVSFPGLQAEIVEVDFERSKLRLNRGQVLLVVEHPSDINIKFSNTAVSLQISTLRYPVAPNLVLMNVLNLVLLGNSYLLLINLVGLRVLNLESV
eukprot:SAG31_NODE_10462_length_1135_cov_6.200772_1_plen_210_part_00